MRLTIRLLGTEVLHLDLDSDSTTPESDAERGDCTTYPVGFTTPERPPLDVIVPDRDF